MSYLELDDLILGATHVRVLRSAALLLRRMMGGSAVARDGVPGRQVRQRHGQPGRCLRPPQRCGVTGGLVPERMRGAVFAQRRVERLVYGGDDRLDAVVIAGGQVIADRARPILDGRPVGILAVAVARMRALGCDHDLVLMRRDERRRQECILGVGLASGRQVVEKVDEWVARGVGAVTRREIDTRGELTAQRGRSASDRQVGTDEARTESALPREKWPPAARTITAPAVSDPSAWNISTPPRTNWRALSLDILSTRACAGAG